MVLFIYLLLIYFGKGNGFLSAPNLLSSTVKMMAKNIAQSSGSKDVSSNPPRVVSGGGVSVRQQIAWAKAYKRFISKSSSTSMQQGKKFRKEKSSKKEALDLGETIDIDFTTFKPPAVFVDGYNIIGFTNSLKGMDNLSADLGEDRDRLINDLCILRGVTGWAIEVIFDAYKAPPSPSTSPFSTSSAGMKSRSQTVDGVAVTFTSNSETADNYIERRFEELRKAGFTNMVEYLNMLLILLVSPHILIPFIQPHLLFIYMYTDDKHI